HDLRGGAYRVAAGRAGDARVGGQAVGPTRPARRAARFRRDRDAPRARHGAARAHRRLPALSGRVIEAHPDGDATVLVAIRDGMSGVLYSVQGQRHWSSLTEEVAPPRLGVGQVCANLDLVAATT